MIATDLIAETPQVLPHTVRTAARPLIEIRDVHKRYRSGRGHVPALQAVSLTIRQGEFVSVLGPSGCGKSTLLSILGLLEKHDQGEYWLAGTNVSALGFNRSSDVRNRHIGLIFQAFNLVAGLSVLENVLLPLRYSRTIPRAQHQQRAMRYLERVGLADRAGDHPDQLSGGQQQRVAIARAMVTDPSLILADEPTGNLDSVRAEEVMTLLREFHLEGATVVMVTHDRSLAAHAGRQIVMRDGRIVEGGDVA